jgi:hypothetical protein
VNPNAPGVRKFEWGYTERSRNFPALSETIAMAETVARKDVLFQCLPEMWERSRMSAMASIGIKLRLLLLAALFALVPAAASAAVEITFYSKEFGTTFPHAFVQMKGQLDETGEKIEANYGFTATHVSPAILMGSVRGEVVSLGQGYIDKSDAHFSIKLTDAEYRQVMATVEQWQSLDQPSYHLNRQNCVFFVARVAAALGMKAETPKELMKKPRSYLQFLTQENQAWLQTRVAQLAER